MSGECRNVPSTAGLFRSSWLRERLARQFSAAKSVRVYPDVHFAAQVRVARRLLGAVASSRSIRGVVSVSSRLGDVGLFPSASSAPRECRRRRCPRPRGSARGVAGPASGWGLQLAALIPRLVCRRASASCGRSRPARRRFSPSARRKSRRHCRAVGGVCEVYEKSVGSGSVQRRGDRRRRLAEERV